MSENYMSFVRPQKSTANCLSVVGLLVYSSFDLEYSSHNPLLLLNIMLNKNRCFLHTELGLHLMFQLVEIIYKGVSKHKVRRHFDFENFIGNAMYE
jgi:hypothetical protein